MTCCFVDFKFSIEFSCPYLLFSLPVSCCCSFKHCSFNLRRTVAAWLQSVFLFNLNRITWLVAVYVFLIFLLFQLFFCPYPSFSLPISCHCSFKYCSFISRQTVAAWLQLVFSFLFLFNLNTITWLVAINIFPTSPIVYQYGFFSVLMDNEGKSIEALTWVLLHVQTVLHQFWPLCSH